MKKFWKVRNDSDIEKKLKYLKLPTDYISLILCPLSSMMEHLCRSNDEYVNISYNDNEKIGHKFGWFESDELSEKYMTNLGYKYVGEITLRKDKLLKISEKVK